MWQYQAWARSPDQHSNRTHEASPPFIEELPAVVIDWFDRPLDVSAVYRSWAQPDPVIIPTFPDFSFDWFDRPLDVSSHYQSWSQPESVGLPPFPTPIDENWEPYIFAVVSGQPAIRRHGLTRNTRPVEIGHSGVMVN